MSHEKYYDYFIATKELSSQLISEWEDLIKSKRVSTQKEMLKETNAIAWTERTNFRSNKTTISGLVYPLEHPIKEETFIKKPKNVIHNGKKALLIVGKANTKQGVKFNNVMLRYSDLLSELPDFRSWLVIKLDCERCSFGGLGKSGVGVSMLKTRAGMIGDLAAIAIPNGVDKLNGGKSEVLTPEGFSKVTYGYWYDLINEA